MICVGFFRWVRERVAPEPAPVPAPRTRTRPVPAARTTIRQTERALPGYTSWYKVSIRDSRDPLIQFNETRKGLEAHIKRILDQVRGIKYVETLQITFEKLSGDETVTKTAYFSSTAETIISPEEIAAALQATREHILNMVTQWISDGSGWTVQSFDWHYFNIVKYQQLAGSSYIELPEKLPVIQWKD